MSEPGKIEKDLMSRLKRIEGQVRGIQKMLMDKRYCIDILTQTSAISSALTKVEDMIMKRHLESCVANAMRSGSPEEQTEKINEVMEILAKFRKS